MSEALPAGSRAVQTHLAHAGTSAQVQQLPDSSSIAADTAELGCEVAAIASSLLFLSDDEPLLVMTSGRHHADLAAAADAHQVRMATAKQVREVAGQAIGGVAPTGHPHPIRTLIDEALAEHPQIWAAAGTPHTVMPLTCDELATLTGDKATRIVPD